MPWYKTGTITVTNGSATVTGASTLWTDVGTLNAGDVLYAPDGKLYEILSINSNTGLTLASNYLGGTLSGQAYSIMPIGLLPSTLAQQVKSTLTTANSALASTVRYDTNSMGLSLTQQQNARTNIAALSAFDVGYGRLSKSVAGGVDVTLTAAEAANQLIELTGTLTANINVIVPAAPRLFWVYNGTSGAFTVTVKTPSGSGVAVQQTGRAMLQCDATNVLFATNYLRSAGVVEDASGNLGLGVTPSAWISSWKSLDMAAGGASLYGTLAIGGVANNTFFDAGLEWRYKASWPATRYEQGSSGTHGWFTAPSGTAGDIITFTLGMALDQSGNLLVGQTSLAANERLAVTGSVANYLARWTNSNATPSGHSIYYGSATPNNTTSQFLYCWDATALRFEVRSNGGIANFSANNVNLSDVRTKKDIQNAPSYLDRICAIPVRTFLYQDQTDDLLNLGVIAQEVEALCPELVDASGFGETPDDGIPLKAVYQTDLQYALMKCIQEQQVLITSLTARIAALEAK